MSKGWIIFIVILILGIITGVVLFILRGNKKQQNTSNEGGTPGAQPADGLETNPGTGNPSSDPQGYVLQIGDVVYNRGTQTIRGAANLNSLNDSSIRVDYAVNEKVGTIQQINTAGDVQVYSAKPSMFGVRNIWLPGGVTNALGK